MVVIRQVSDKVGVYPPRPCSQSDHSGDEECHAQQRSKRSPPTSAGGCLQDGDFIERLWETEGLSAVKNAFDEKERKRKREKDCTAHGHGVVPHSLLRHDGHFTPARPKLKHMRHELDFGEQKAQPRCACCRDSVAKATSTGVTVGDGDVEEGYCGLQYFGGQDGARPRSHAAGGCPTEQAECFDSSFDLLTIEPRKLRTGFTGGGCKFVKLFCTREPSPSLPVESMHSPCDSLSPSSPDKRLTSDNVKKLGDDSSCDTPTDMSPPDSPTGGLVKVPERPKSVPQKQESPGITYEDADQLSPRQYGLYGMANVRLRASSQRLASQFRNWDICNGFTGSCRPASRVATAALRDAHMEALQKARNPGTATRLDNMKASILCHGFYPRLVEAYMRLRRVSVISAIWVGASPEMKKLLRELQAQVRDWRPPNMNDFNANEAVNKFHSMITAYEKDLERPFQKSMTFCDGLEKELESMESTTRGASHAIRSIPLEQIRSVRDINTSMRKPVWR